MLPLVDTVLAFVSVILLASLLVTVLNQIVLWFANQRGKNLLWGVQMLLREMHVPDKIEEKLLNEKVVKEISQKILTFSLICSSESKMAQVIRMEELGDVLGVMATDPGRFELSKEAKDWFQKMGLQKSCDEFKAKVENWLKVWFDNMADRMSERFAIYSKVWAAVLALLVACVLQLDSITLFNNLSKNEAARNAIVAASPAILDKAQQILNENAPLRALQAEYSAISKTPLGDPGKTPGSDAEAKWVQDKIEKSQDLTEADKQRLIQNYQAAVNGDLGQKVALANDLMGKFDTLGLKGLVGFGLDWDKNPGQKVLGILISALFMSLGAPFWFNALRQIANLRSRLMIAEQAEREKRKSGDDGV